MRLPSPGASARPGRRVGRRALALVAGALAVGLALAGCTNDSLAQQYRSGNGKGYIAGSSVTEIDPGKRADPLEFDGKTAAGKHVTAEQYHGHVLVMNFWYATCPPCRAEAKDLESISKKFRAQGVEFLGVNTRDGAAAVGSFDDKFGVTYPSILDADTGAVQLAFSGVYRPNATPTTFVIDKKGRVAARIEGNVGLQPSTLETLIRDAVGEGE